MRLILSFAAVLLGSASAWASGGFGCTSEGGAAAIELNAGVTHGMGGPIFSFSATADITDTDVAGDLRKTVFEKEHVAQYWLDGEDLRLLLYRERPAEKEHGYVEVEIRAKGVADEEGSYAGTYLVTAWDGAGAGEPKEKKFEGQVSCMGE